MSEQAIAGSGSLAAHDKVSMLPRVSILVTSYNQARYLEEAIASAVGQTYGNVEVIVVDDGSTDGSVALIDDWSRRFPEKVKAILLPRDQPGTSELGIATGRVSRVRNHALSVATGKYVTTLDGDDVYLPEKVAREIAVAEAHGGKVVVYSNFHWIDTEGRRTGTWHEGTERLPEGMILEELFRCDFPKSEWGRCELIPRAALGPEINDARLAIYEDLDLKLRLAAALPFHAVREPLHCYRRGGVGVSASRAEVYYTGMRQIWAKEKHLLERLAPPARRNGARTWRRAMANHAISAACERLEQGRNAAALVFLTRGFRASPGAVPLRLWLRCCVPRAQARRWTAA